MFPRSYCSWVFRVGGGSHIIFLHSQGLHQTWPHHRAKAQGIDSHISDRWPSAYLYNSLCLQYGFARQEIWQKKGWKPYPRFTAPDLSTGSEKVCSVQILHPWYTKSARTCTILDDLSQTFVANGLQMDCWFMLVHVGSSIECLPVSPFSRASSAFSKRWGSQQPLKNAKEDKEVDVFFRKAPLGFRMAHKQSPLKVDFLYSYSVHLQRTEQIWFWHLPPVGCFSLFFQDVSRSLRKTPEGP